MPNPKHLAILKEGVDVWNAWRVEHPEVEPDLSGINLNGANLRRANLEKTILYSSDLRRVDLRLANLVEANLTGADLSYSVLFRANLTRAILHGADLIRTDLAWAVLLEADLSWATLLGTSFRGGTLARADLSRAKLYEVNFANTDLSGTKGLKSCEHRGPSIIDHRTIARNPELPHKFLKGVGLTEEIIRAYQGKNSISIEFTSARYGHLIPIEYALRTRLGDDYIVEKNADRIVVKLGSPEQFQAALDAVIPVLMALGSASPGEPKRLAIESHEGTSEQMENEELMAVLLYLVNRFEEENPPPKLTPGQEAVVEAVKGGLRGVIGHALQKLFEARGETEHQIYRRFKPTFESLKSVTELPAHEEETPKQLPPAPEDDT